MGGEEDEPEEEKDRRVGVAELLVERKILIAARGATVGKAVRLNLVRKRLVNMLLVKVGRACL